MIIIKFVFIYFICIIALTGGFHLYYGDSIEICLHNSWLIAMFFATGFSMPSGGKMSGSNRALLAVILVVFFAVSWFCVVNEIGVSKDTEIQAEYERKFGGF